MYTSFHVYLEDDLTLVRDIEIQNWAAELSDPESCQLQVSITNVFLLLLYIYYAKSSGRFYY